MAASSRRRLLAAALFAAAEGLRRPEGSFKKDRGGGVLGRGGELLTPPHDAESPNDILWDLAVTEAVNEVHPITQVKERQPGGTDVHAGRYRPVEPGGKPPRFLYFAHHKAGTDLLRSLAQEQSRVMKRDSCVSYGLFGWKPEVCWRTPGPAGPAQVWFYCWPDLEQLTEFTDLGFDVRIAHIIRDPIAMVLSGYLYHMQAKNQDIPVQLMPLRKMSMKNGLKLEVEFFMNYTAPAMLDTYFEAPPDTLHVRFESFTQSSAGFNETAWKLYDHMAGDILTQEEREELQDRAATHDLMTYPDSHSEGHVADPKMKKKVKRILNRLPRKALKELKALRKTFAYQ